MNEEQIKSVDKPIITNVNEVYAQKVLLLIWNGNCPKIINKPHRKF